jgi:hypothetical protein
MTTQGKYVAMKKQTEVAYLKSSFLPQQTGDILVQIQTLCVTCHTSNVTRHTSNVTRHMSHVTRHLHVLGSVTA